MANQGRFGLTVFVALLLALVLFLFYFGPSILGAVVEVEETKTQTLDLKIESSETKTITLQDFPGNNYLSAFKLSGNLQTSDENADVKVYLQAGGKKYLVFDYATVKDLAVNHITGFAVKEGGGGESGDNGGGNSKGGNSGGGYGGSSSSSPSGGSSSSASSESTSSDSAASADTSSTIADSNSETITESSADSDTSTESASAAETSGADAAESQATPEESTSTSSDSGNEVASSATTETSTETESAQAAEETTAETGNTENMAAQETNTFEQAETANEAESEPKANKFGSASDKKEKGKKQTYVFHDLCIDTCNLKNENLETEIYELVFEISGEVELKISDASYGVIEKENQANNETTNNNLNETLPENQTNETPANTNTNETNTETPPENATVSETIIAAPSSESTLGGTSPTGTTTETAATIAAPIEAALPTTQAIAPLAATGQPLAEVVASSPSSQTILFKSIDAGVPATSIISAPAVGITEVSFALKDSASSMKLEVETLPEMPAGIQSIGGGAAPAITGAAVASEALAYQYLRLTVSGGASSSDVSSAKIKFEVSKGWLAENNYNKESVRLNRWHGGAWNELPTKLMSETPDSHTYETESPGFSVFAITANRANAALQQIPAMPVQTPAISTTGITTSALTSLTALQPSKGSTSWLLVLIAAAISYFIFANKNKRRR